MSIYLNCWQYLKKQLGLNFLYIIKADPIDKLGNPLDNDENKPSGDIIAIEFDSQKEY